jgi:hypothetical protein
VDDFVDLRTSKIDPPEGGKNTEILTKGYSEKVANLTR